MRLTVQNPDAESLEEYHFLLRQNGRMDCLPKGLLEP